MAEYQYFFVCPTHVGWVHAQTDDLARERIANRYSVPVDIVRVQPTDGPNMFDCGVVLEPTGFRFPNTITYGDFERSDSHDDGLSTVQGHP